MEKSEYKSMIKDIIEELKFNGIHLKIDANGTPKHFGRLKGINENVNWSYMEYFYFNNEKDTLTAKALFEAVDGFVLLNNSKSIIVYFDMAWLN